MNEFEHKLRAAEKLAAKSSVSRRDFLQLAALAGLTIPAANALLMNSARAQEAKKGGNFIIGMEGGSASDSLDPSTYANSVMIARVACDLQQPCRIRRQRQANRRNV